MDLDDDDLLYEHWRGADGVDSRRYTHIPTGISVSQQDGPMLGPIYKIHAELRRQLAEKVIAHLAKHRIHHRGGR